MVDSPHNDEKKNLSNTEQIALACYSFPDAAAPADLLSSSEPPSSSFWTSDDQTAEELLESLGLSDRSGHSCAPATPDELSSFEIEKMLAKMDKIPTSTFRDLLEQKTRSETDWIPMAVHSAPQATPDALPLIDTHEAIQMRKAIASHFQNPALPQPSLAR